MQPVRFHSRYCFAALAADALSAFRLVIALVIVWLGGRFGRAALPAVIILATLGWIGDGVDGPLARHSPCPTRLGRLDYPLDVTLTWAELLYAALANFISPYFVLAYTAGTIAVTLWFRRKAVLALFMRGIDIVALIIILRYAPLYLPPMLLWLLFLGVVHRRRVRRDILRWLNELASLFHPKRKPPDEEA